MIVTKTPFRISFFGGGSDIPKYYQQSEGLVVSATIDKYLYIAMNFSEVKHFKLMYSKIELVHDIDKLQHDRARESIRKYKDYLPLSKCGIEIGSYSDIISYGSGLGSSSSFTVGLLNAIRSYGSGPFSKYELAEDACDIEINKCGHPIGKQDQYAAAFGGFNVFSFEKERTIAIPLIISFTNTVLKLERNLLVINTNLVRNSDDILTAQVKNLTTKEYIKFTDHLVKKAEESISLFAKGDLDSIGNLLHQTWLVKKMLTDNVTTNYIDFLYDIGINEGALGGKLLGAGGGGYLMFYFDNYEKKIHAEGKFYEMGHKALRFNFSNEGSSVMAKNWSAV